MFILKGVTPSLVARKLAATKASLERLKDSPSETLNAPGQKELDPDIEVEV